MFITNEYSRLIGNGCNDIVLLPNQPFDAFEGNYTVTAYVRVLDKNGKDVVKLQAGDSIKGIGIISKPRKPRKKKAVEDD